MRKSRSGVSSSLDGGFRRSLIARDGALGIRCPSCSQNLQLDVGFAGGVCRCANCGELMAVPADPVSHNVEPLRRPERPSRPQTPGQEPGAATASGAETFTTRSGRTVRIDVNRVPVARLKKRAIKVSVVLVFVLVMAALAGGVATAVIMLIKSAETPTGITVDPREAHREAIGYDPDANPFTDASANLLGVRVQADACLVIDASGTRLGWFDPVKKAVRILAGKGGHPGGLRVVFAMEQGPISYPAPTATTGTVSDGINAFLDSAEALGAADLYPAVELALAGGAKQLVLVTGQRVFDDQVEQLATLLKPEPGVQLDVILMQRNAPDLCDLARRRGGTCVMMSSRQILQWQTEAGVQ